MKAIPLALLTAFAYVLPGSADEISIRQDKPTVIAAQLGFPTGLGVMALHNIDSQFAFGGSLGYALFFANASALGRYYFDEQAETTFAEVRLNVNPFGGGSYIPTPGFGAHALYGWEGRHEDGHYSHIALGFGVNTTGDPNLLLGIINVEAAIGRAF